ncbi:protein Ccc1p [Monosporozyma unispora]|nr:Protein ccc1 [Kazachstania unispora]
MSLVALKNALISKFYSNNNNNSQSRNGSNTNISNSTSPPLMNNDDPNNSNNYGTNDQNDMEANIDNIYSNSFIDEKNEDDGFFNTIDPRMISDLIIGLSDGLTVPFALTAGLSSLGDSKVVITGGFAELISGAISMGLGGYLGAKSELDYYKAEVKNERRKFYQDTTLVNHDVEDILLSINPDFSEETIVSFIKDLQNSPELMLDFIIRYGRELDEPAENRQVVSAATIGGGYLLGGIVPLLPYFFVSDVGTGLFYSIIVMTITLFIFGYFKAVMSMGDNCTTNKKIVEGVEMIVVGGAAAGAAWFFVKLLG